MSLGIPLNPVSLLTSLVTAQKPAAKAPSPGISASAANSLAQAASFSNLNLTNTEQAQISAILKSSQGQPFSQIASRIQGVLTPAQKQTFAADLQGLQSHKAGHHGGSGSSSTIDTDTDAFGVASLSSAASTSATSTSASSLFGDLAAMFSAQSQTQPQNQLLGL